MNFRTSIETCFKKFADFKEELQIRVLVFYLLSYGTIGLLAFLSLRSPQVLLFVVSGIFIIVIIVPFTAVTARRLHDVGRSGWWQLISGMPYVGIIGAIFLIIWWCSEGEKEK